MTGRNELEELRKQAEESIRDVVQSFGNGDANIAVAKATMFLAATLELHLDNIENQLDMIRVDVAKPRQVEDASKPTAYDPMVWT